jgi:uncharacterized protein YcgI (DUF1989 family)
MLATRLGPDERLGPADAQALASPAMHRYPVPGRVVREWVIPTSEYAAFSMQPGQVLRFIDVEGQQVPDLACFNANDLSDHLNLGNTMLLNKRRELQQGDVLYSVVCNPMMTVVGASNWVSYSYGPMCSEELNHLRYGVPGTRNCRDNFAVALAPFGFDRRQIPNAFVPFMRVEVDAQGSMEIREPTSEPGDYYDLRAEMELLVAVSNCPQERNPCNAFKPTPIGIVIYQPSDAAAPEAGSV